MFAANPQLPCEAGDLFLSNIVNDFDNRPGVALSTIRLPLPLTRPWLSWIVLGLTVLAFVGQVASELLVGGDILSALGAKHNVYIAAGQVWRFVTPVLLHGGLMHIAFNVYALYALGPEVESLYGTARFAIIYLLAGIAGNVLSFMFSPAPSLGASTALFGLIATELAFFYRHRDKFGEFGQSQLTNIFVVVAVNFSLGLSPGSRIDNWGHLGGFIGGAVTGWLLCPQYAIESAYGFAMVVDHNSLQRAWPQVAGVALALSVIAYAAILAQW
jgi:rhomboid protease GluP